MNKAIPITTIIIGILLIAGGAYAYYGTGISDVFGDPGVKYTCSGTVEVNAFAKDKLVGTSCITDSCTLLRPNSFLPDFAVTSGRIIMIGDGKTLASQDFETFATTDEDYTIRSGCVEPETKVQLNLYSEDGSFQHGVTV